MDALIKYRHSDGGIVGVWTASPASHLVAQIPTEDAAHGYLLHDATEDPGSLEMTSYVHEELLLTKQALTLTANVPTFAADGMAECAITVEPFVPCDVVVNGAVVPLTAEDPTLVLTADIPTVFTIALAPMVAYRADPVTVEAT